jgi:hypothetical protein
VASFEEDPYDALARELRLGEGVEMRAEAEMAELETHRGRLRHRTLDDLARLWAARGDIATVSVGGATHTGPIVHVGSDYLTLDTPTHIVEIRLASALIRIERQRAGGLSLARGSATFAARLAEFEHTGELLTLLAGREHVKGRIAVAAVDHVVVVDTSGGEVVLPRALIDAVIRPRPTR